MARVLGLKDPFDPGFEEVSHLSQDSQRQRQQQKFTPGHFTEEDSCADQSSENGTRQISPSSFDCLCWTDLWGELFAAPPAADKIGDRITDHNNDQKPKHPKPSVGHAKKQKKVRQKKPAVQAAEQHQRESVPAFEPFTGSKQIN